jgi:hypothetical protein
MDLPFRYFDFVRRSLRWSLWTAAIAKHVADRQHEVFYDRRSIAFSIHPLFDHRLHKVNPANLALQVWESLQTSWTLEADELPEFPRRHLSAKCRVVIRCEFVEIVSLRHPASGKTEDWNRPLVQFLEIATSQELFSRSAPPLLP